MEIPQTPFLSLILTPPGAGFRILLCARTQDLLVLALLLAVTANEITIDNSELAVMGAR